MITVFYPIFLIRLSIAVLPEGMTVEGPKVRELNDRSKYIK